MKLLRYLLKESESSFDWFSSLTNRIQVKVIAAELNIPNENVRKVYLVNAAQR
jgi:hypothetical protein